MDTNTTINKGQYEVHISVFSVYLKHCLFNTTDVMIPSDMHFIFNSQVNMASSYSYILDFRV